MAKVKLPVRLSDIVTKYKGNGRALGYPTANIDAQTDLPDGVYFGFADLAEYTHHPAIIFIGTPTTVGDTERRVEAHLLDITDQDYYGKKISMDIQKYHRPNQTFNSVEELLKAMRADDQASREWFAKKSKKRDN